MNINNKKLLTLFSSVTILFWLSLLFYLPPINLTSEIKNLVDQARESKQFAPEVDKAQELLEDEIVHSLRVEFAKYLVIISLGIISGFLLLRRRRSGQILAIILCSFMLVLRSITYIGDFSNIPGRLYGIFVYMLTYRPIYTIHVEYFGLLFLIMTIVFLTRRTISAEFLRRKQTDQEIVS